MKLLNTQNCTLYVCVVFVFKLLTHPNRNDWFHIFQNVRYDTRSSPSGNSSVPFIPTMNSRQSIDYTGPKCWNSTPNELKSVKTYLSFKRGFRKHLLQNQIWCVFNLVWILFPSFVYVYWIRYILYYLGTFENSMSSFTSTVFCLN